MRKHSKRLISDLEKRALFIRRHIIKMIHKAGSGHPGGSLSAVEILTALYFHVMKIDPKKPNWNNRDRFILSKGHACPALYATLAERGYFPVKELDTLRKIGSKLQGHPDMKKTPGVDITSGSLGQGLSVGVGMALAAKIDQKKYHTYVLLGDGELQEGQIWEAVMSAAHYRLNNLTVIIDRNGLQVDGTTSKIMEVSPIGEKWRAFNWGVIEAEGHNFNEILDALIKAKKSKSKPFAVIVHTIKGKGISFMENKVDWHGRSINDKELQIALKELEA